MSRKVPATKHNMAIRTNRISPSSTNDEDYQSVNLLRIELTEIGNDDDSNGTNITEVVVSPLSNTTKEPEEEVMYTQISKMHFQAMSSMDHDHVRIIYGHKAAGMTEEELDEAVDELDAFKAKVKSWGKDMITMHIVTELKKELGNEEFTKQKIVTLRDINRWFRKVKEENIDDVRAILYKCCYGTLSENNSAWAVEYEAEYMEQKRLIYDPNTRYVDKCVKAPSNDGRGCIARMMTEAKKPLMQKINKGIAEKEKRIRSNRTSEEIAYDNAFWKRKGRSIKPPGFRKWNPDINVKLNDANETSPEAKSPSGRLLDSNSGKQTRISEHLHPRKTTSEKVASTAAVQDNDKESEAIQKLKAKDKVNAELIRRGMSNCEKLIAIVGQRERQRNDAAEKSAANVAKQRADVRKARQDEIKAANGTGKKKRPEKAKKTTAAVTDKPSTNKEEVQTDTDDKSTEEEEETEEDNETGVEAITEIVSCRRFQKRLYMTVLWSTGETQKVDDPSLVMGDEWQLVLEYVNERINKKLKREGDVLKELLEMLQREKKTDGNYSIERDEMLAETEQRLNEMVSKEPTENRKRATTTRQHENNCNHEAIELEEENNSAYCKEGYKLNMTKCMQCKGGPRLMVEKENGQPGNFKPTASAPAHHCRNVEKCKYVLCHECFTKQIQQGSGRKRARRAMV